MIFCQSVPGLFISGMGIWKNGNVKLAVTETARPRFVKTRSVAYALQSGIEAELAQLESAAIISDYKRRLYSHSRGTRTLLCKVH